MINSQKHISFIIDLCNGEKNRSGGFVHCTKLTTPSQIAFRGLRSIRRTGETVAVFVNERRQRAECSNVV